MKLSFVFLLTVIAFSLGKVRYDGHKVIRLEAKSDWEVQLLRRLEEAGEIDVWSHDAVVVKGMNEIMVSPNASLKLRAVFSPERQKVKISNVQHLIEAEELHNRQSIDSWFAAYHPTNEIRQFLEQTAALYPEIMTFVPSIGKTYEGQDIFAVRITGKGDNLTKKQIWINGGQHAREWIAIATVLFIVDQLVGSYEADTNVTNILNNIEFIVVPLINIDGYDYSWSTNRLWRKNRKPSGSGDFGVDLNRNWANYWGGAGSSGITSSEIYRGVNPFSESETKAVSDYILANPRIVAGIDFHSYSELILRPWGWGSTTPLDDDILKEISVGMREAIFSVNQMLYTSLAAYELYLASGTASDWFQADGSFYGFCIELRDQGQYGFLLPPNQIIPTGTEAFEAVRFLANFMIGHSSK